MKLLEPYHGYCDALVYGVVVPVKSSFADFTVYVDFDRQTGELNLPTEAHRETSPDVLEPFAAPNFVLRKAEALAREFAGVALPKVN